jgi:hypothetical protein
MGDWGAVGEGLGALGDLREEGPGIFSHFPDFSFLGHSLVILVMCDLKPGVTYITVEVDLPRQVDLPPDPPPQSKSRSRWDQTKNLFIIPSLSIISIISIIPSAPCATQMMVKFASTLELHSSPVAKSESDEDKSSMLGNDQEEKILSYVARRSSGH